MTSEALLNEPVLGPLGVPRDYQPDSRIEPIPKTGFPHHKYPRWIGHKFTPSGDVLRFPGNCIVAHLDPASCAHHALQALHADLEKQDFASSLVLTPPNSYHMTVYECVTDQIRIRHSYPGDLSLNTSKEDCDAYLASKLADFEPRLGPKGIGAVTVLDFDPLTDGLGLKLQPANESALRQMRDRLSGILKMRHPGHENYSWHMTLGYLLCHLSSDVKAQMEAFLVDWLPRLCDSFHLGFPEFCVYDNMMHFERVLFVGEQATKR